MSNMIAKFREDLVFGLSDVERSIDKFNSKVRLIHDIEYYREDNAWLPEIKSMSINLCVELKELHSELMCHISGLKSAVINSGFNEDEDEGVLELMKEARQRLISNAAYDLKDTVDKVTRTLTYVIEDYMEGDSEKETLLKETNELYLGLVTELS